MGREQIFSQVIPASDFSVNTDFDVPVLAAYRYENDNPLVVEETYIVSWDGQEYECVAQDGSAVYPTAVFIGNAQDVGLAGNSEPFIIGQTEQIPLNFFSLTDTQPTQHSVEIYLVTKDVETEEPEEEEPEETDGIVIYNHLGNRVEYGSYSKLLINRVSGNQTIFSEGDAGETTVALNFSGGDMTVLPDKHKLFDKVIIPVPENFTTENIKKGVRIAGIEGTAEGNKRPVLNLESTLLTFSYDEGIQKNIYTGEGITYIVPDANYIVTFGSQDFPVKAEWVDYLGEKGMALLGNKEVFGGEASDFPFLVIASDDGEMIIIDYDGSESSRYISIALKNVSLETETRTLEFTESDGVMTTQSCGIAQLIPGCTYDVEWDGEVFRRKAAYLDAGVIMLGNVAVLFGHITDEPFILGCIGTQVVLAAVFDTESVTHTFGLKMVETGSPAVYLADETTLRFAEDGNDYINLNGLKINSVAPVDYKITWDGTEYICTGTLDEAIEQGIISADPFMIMVGMGRCIVIANDTATEHTIKIEFNRSGTGETIDPLMLEEVYSEIATIQASKFYGDDIVKKVVLPKATSIGNYAFYHCSNLEYVNIPAAKSLGQNCFQMATKLVTLDTASLTSIDTRAINGNSAMTTLILRNPNAVATLSLYNITGGPIYNKTNGYIYVPKSLLSSYKAATNWSTYASQFRALEDYTIDGTIYGELDETKI